ncbi:MAG TPA: DUF2007 domain-containing protein [bacterium]|nr:DUF2007 domain-containing protein [bacterium]
MKYCHSCRYEFQDTMDVCPDCGVTLREDPPAPEEYREVEWVELRQLPSPIYLEMVKEILDNEGIPNYLSFNFLSSTFSIRGASLVGESGKLFVPEEFREEALNLIEPLIDEGETGQEE